MAFEALGYELAHHGEGRWNGVAIASRVGLADVVVGFDPLEDPCGGEARLVSASCRGIRLVSLYAPNGRAVGSEHFERKLAWFERLSEWLEARHRPDEAIVLCGDFNVAPDDRDVYDPEALEGSTHVTPEERAALARLREWGFADAFRHVYDDAGLYTWWDYRAGNFHKGLGMRIDLVYATRPVMDRVVYALVDRNARKGEQPSDHAPVLVDLAPGG
jgi:exodeoxyribonuclease-3